jgi:Ferritin-like
MADPSEWSIDDLRRHLQAAVELELLLIPPYLCAMCSLKDGSNREAAMIIRSVVVEEMLHMTLASNLLNAVGGTPVLTDREWVGHYPTRIPFHTRSFAVGLRPFDDTALSTFLAVETPTYPIAEPPPAPDDAATPRMLAVGNGPYKTIGAFYGAIQAAFVHLVERDGPDAVFTGHQERQVGPEHYYASAGTARKILGLTDAREALREIVEQGEGDGTGPAPDEKFDIEKDLAHFYRFNELRQRRRYRVGDLPLEPTGDRVEIDWDAVYPMQPNLRVADLPDDGVRDAAIACDAIWYGLLQQLEVALTGEPERLRLAVGQMFSLKYAMVDLMRIRLPNGLNAAPTFELPPA